MAALHPCRHEVEHDLGHRVTPLRGALLFAVAVRRATIRPCLAVKTRRAPLGVNGGGFVRAGEGRVNVLTQVELVAATVPHVVRTRSVFWPGSVCWLLA